MKQRTFFAGLLTHSAKLLPQILDILPELLKRLENVREKAPKESDAEMAAILERLAEATEGMAQELSVLRTRVYIALVFGIAALIISALTILSVLLK